MNKPSYEEAYLNLRFYNGLVVLPCEIKRNYQGRTAQGESEVRLMLEALVVNGSSVSLSKEELASYDADDINFKLSLTSRKRPWGKRWEKNQIYQKAKNLVKKLRNNQHITLQGGM